MGSTIPRQVDLGYIRIITEHEPGREREPVKSFSLLSTVSSFEFLPWLLGEELELSE